MKKKEKNNYFGEIEENAVVEYIISDSSDERHRLYNKILRKPFNKMVSSILRKYNNHIGNYNIKDVEADGLSHLLMNMIKYRPYIIEYRDSENPESKWIRHKKYRFLFKEEMYKKLEELNNDNTIYEYRDLCASAYSYCGTIVRNFFKDHSKNSRNEIVNNIDIESTDFKFDEDLTYSYEENYFDEFDPIMKIFNGIIDEIELIIENNNELTKKEIIVGYGILELFKNWETLFKENTLEGEYDKKVSNNFNKSKIFFLLKEYTRMDLKEIRQNMKPYKIIYNFLKKNNSLN